MADETPLSPAPASACGSCALWWKKNNFAGSLGKCNAFVPNRSCRAETIRNLPDWGLTQKPYSMRNSESIRRLSSSVTNAFSSFCAPQKRKATTEPQHTEIACDNPRQPSLKPKKTQIVIKFKPIKSYLKPTKKNSQARSPPQKGVVLQNILSTVQARHFVFFRKKEKFLNAIGCKILH